MIWEELEKRLNHYLYENLDHTIWGKFEHGDRRLNLHGIIYLCKKCYEEGKRNVDSL